jgi:hypothetical protein
MSRKCSTKFCCVNGIDFLSASCRTGPPGYIGWRNRFLKRLHIRAQESIPGLIKSLKIRALQTEARISSSNLRPDLRMSQSNGSSAIYLPLCMFYFNLMSFLNL